VLRAVFMNWQTQHVGNGAESSNKEVSLVQEVATMEFAGVGAHERALVSVRARRLHLLAARLEQGIRPARYASTASGLALRAMLALASASIAPDPRSRRRHLRQAHDRLLRYRTTLYAMFDRGAIGVVCLEFGVRVASEAIAELAASDLAAERAAEPSTDVPVAMPPDSGAEARLEDAAPAGAAPVELAASLPRPFDVGVSAGFATRDARPHHAHNSNRHDELLELPPSLGAEEADPDGHARLEVGSGEPRTA
jgi:hypothetical protein